MMTPDRIQFIGHSCLWITLDNHHFIVDTNLSKRIFGIITRHSQVGIDLQNIPDVSALLVTHAHYDHLDLFSYKYFSQKKPMILPSGLGRYVSRFLHNPVIELKTWASTEHPPVKITAVPTRHYGFRISGLTYTRCNGYIIRGTQNTIFHPGDTAYGTHFKDIASRYKIDVACLPIGASRPRWLMKGRHMNPEEALQAFQDLGAQKMIPIHWGSFRLGLDQVSEPMVELNKLIHGTSLSKSVIVLNPGESSTL